MDKQSEKKLKKLTLECKSGSEDKEGEVKAWCWMKCLCVGFPDKEDSVSLINEGSILLEDMEIRCWSICERSGGAFDESASEKKFLANKNATSFP